MEEHSQHPPSFDMPLSLWTIQKHLDVHARHISVHWACPPFQPMEVESSGPPSVEHSGLSQLTGVMDSKAFVPKPFISSDGPY